LFYLLGEILFQSKAVNIILESVDKLIGKVRARLNVTAICVGTVLGTLSGAAMADAAVLGATLLPEMTRRGYDKTLSLGSILCAGCLGAIIPPSVLAVLIGVLANVSISKLLIAGFLPGLFMASIFILYILVRVRINPGLAPIYTVSKIPNREKMIAVMRTLPFSLIIFLVMGLILLGIATPTEAAGTGVIGALIIVGLFKRLNFQVLKESALATMQLSGMIFFIVAGSKSFSQLLAMSGATKELLETIVNIPIPALGTFAAMQIIPLFLGCFIDPISIIMIAVPIYVPVVEALHFEPVWFWLIFLINMTLGGITPPFGLVLFTLKGASPEEVTIADIYRGAIQFVFLILFCILCITIFPSIAVWLPNYLLP
jgi:tripartite ATP-independent transporter DctM subunit